MENNVFERDIFGEDEMELFGESLAPVLKNVKSVHLNGNLGMGKTTLVRGLLKGLGYIGPVKSPTYTLVEPYTLGDLEVFHFDLYRVTDPEELEFMGIRDYFRDQTLCLIEWAEMGGDLLPQADVEIALDLVRYGRKVKIIPISSQGQVALAGLQNRLAG